MTVYEFIKALKYGKTNVDDWKKVVKIVNKLKLNNILLTAVQLGLNKISDTELKKISESLKQDID